MSELPQIILDELKACPLANCMVREARGEFGAVLAGPSYLECKTCGQIWGLTSSGGHFKHWSKAGEAVYEPVEVKINSKWPKWEHQTEPAGHGSPAFKMRFVDAERIP